MYFGRPLLLGESQVPTLCHLEMHFSSVVVCCGTNEWLSDQQAGKNLSAPGGGHSRFSELR